MPNQPPKTRRPLRTGRRPERTPEKLRQPITVIGALQPIKPALIKTTVVKMRCATCGSEGRIPLTARQVAGVRATLRGASFRCAWCGQWLDVVVPRLHIVK